MSPITIAYCTFPDEATAARICEKLVLEKVIKCANLLGPMCSIYEWKGEMKRDAEWVAILKTSTTKRAKLKERIQAEHPYETPALIFLAVEDGLPAFLSWVSEE